jgi:hypothetical protein
MKPKMGSINSQLELLKEDVRNKMPDFRLQTIDCGAVIVQYLTSYFSRLSKKQHSPCIFDI